MNEPVAWMQSKTTELPDGCECMQSVSFFKANDDDIPLYTHPVKELTDKITEQEKFIKAILKKGGCDGNICQKYNANPAKELTDEEIWDWFKENTALTKESALMIARAILRKAQEK